MRESGKEMREMEKMKGGKKVEEVAMVGDKRGCRRRKKKGRREGGEACTAQQQYTIINLTESVIERQNICIQRTLCVCARVCMCVFLVSYLNRSKET